MEGIPIVYGTLWGFRPFIYEQYTYRIRHCTWFVYRSYTYMNETVYSTVYGDVDCSYIYMYENIRTVYDQYTVRLYTEPNIEATYERYTVKYIWTVYEAVYGVVHGAVYRSYKKQKQYIRVGLVYRSYTFRTTVRIRSIFSRGKIMLAALLGLCGGGKRNTFSSMPSVLTLEAVNVEFRDYFLDVLIACTRKMFPLTPQPWTPKQGCHHGFSRNENRLSTT